MKHAVLKTPLMMSKIVLLFLCIVAAMASQAAQVPPSVYQRYQTLAIQFAKLNTPQPKVALTEKEKTTLVDDITDFYQQQADQSLARQLLGSNLYLPLLLQQQRYKPAYYVVDALLMQPLDSKQQLTFQQLAAQLAAQFKTSKDKKNNAWALVEQHLIAWFKLVDQHNAEQQKSLGINSTQTASNAALLAQAFYLQKKLAQALPFAERAYRAFPKQKPYMTLVLALLQGLEDHKALNRYLKIAVVDFPKTADFWHRLAYSYLSLNKHQLALSTLAITRNQGLLDKQGYKALSALYLQYQQPRLAATIMQESAAKKLVKKDQTYYESLTNAWLMARDRDQALLTIQAAKVAGYQTLKQAQQQAQLFYLQGKWPDAEMAYQALLNTEIKKPQKTKKEVEKQSLKRDKWLFLLAMSQLEQEKKTIAKGNLQKLQTKQYQGYAKDWLAQL